MCNIYIRRSNNGMCRFTKAYTYDKRIELFIFRDEQFVKGMYIDFILGHFLSFLYSN